MFGWLRQVFTRSHFARLDTERFPTFEPGTVWLVGAGPGAPGLLSLFGYHALGAADVIVHDALVSKDLLKFTNPQTQIIPAGKRGGKPSAKQVDISQTIIELAKSGKRVLRLKGGDPFMFGRGGEEAVALHQAGIKFRIVPGITAGIGGLAYAGIPVTHRDTNQAVIFLTGHDGDGAVPQAVDWDAVANAAPVIVMYMALKHLPAITEKLRAAGRKSDDKIAIVSNASLTNQSILTSTLGQVSDIVANSEIPTPAIVVLGPVVDFSDILKWHSGSHGEGSFG